MTEAIIGRYFAATKKLKIIKLFSNYFSKPIDNNDALSTLYFLTLFIQKNKR
jgi:hypothetical protein